MKTAAWRKKVNKYQSNSPALIVNLFWVLFIQSHQGGNLSTEVHQAGKVLWRTELVVSRYKGGSLLAELISEVCDIKS